MPNSNDYDVRLFPHRMNPMAGDAAPLATDHMLATYLEASQDLCETNSILFGAAMAVCRIIGSKLPMAGRAVRQSSAIPARRKRIEDRITKARALIGRLTSFRSGNIDRGLCVPL
ncbi:unnamed protein product [Parnassius apollo]|uniref:(apollo) hypothetical protein n=1 Tax=Parnassius apollo TaxID=110799 RepID=A0A8S3YFM7_PARAO|nr:unnamed protein product [Parnassius apollo]